MSGIKRIFLDLDGPLLDGKSRHYFCYQSILDRFGFKPVGIDEYWEKKRSGCDQRDLLVISGASGIYDEFLSAWLALIESQKALALDKVQEGAVECLREWRKRQIKLILVTVRKNEQALEEQLEVLGLRRLLDSVLVCGHAAGGRGKADAAEKMRGDENFKENTLWIGDTEVDWEAAGYLGCQCVLLSNGLREEARLTSLRGAVIKPSIASLRNVL